MDPASLKNLVRSVVGRVMAERGRAEHPAGRPEVPGARSGGVFVRVEGAKGPPRPAQEQHGAGQRGRELVTAEALRGLERGARLRVPPGTLVTDLAREEAWRRGIAIDERATGDAGRLRVAVAADHGGLKLKDELAQFLRSLGHEVLDLGTKDGNAVDYPDFARAAAKLVSSRQADFAVVVDGAGIGSAMVANKVAGVRAANCWNEASAKNAREHNFANLLTLGAGHLTVEQARQVVRVFLTTAQGEERHARRVKKIDELDRRRGTGGCG